MFVFIKKMGNQCFSIKTLNIIRLENDMLLPNFSLASLDMIEFQFTESQILLKYFLGHDPHNCSTHSIFKNKSGPTIAISLC